MSDRSGAARPLVADVPPPGRAGVEPPLAPNTAFVYLLNGPEAPPTLRRVVFHGAATDEHEERIRAALSGGRYFLPAVVEANDEQSAEVPLACCEFVLLSPTLASPSDARHIEDVVAQLESAALYGWNVRPMTPELRIHRPSPSTDDDGRLAIS